MRHAWVTAAIWFAGCAPARGSPTLKGSCEPPEPKVTIATGPARPVAMLRVSVVGFDGTDQDQLADLTVTPIVNVSEQAIRRDSALDPELDDAAADARLFTADPGTWVFRHGGRALDDVHIPAGLEVALAASDSAQKYYLNFTCTTGSARVLLPAERGRLIDVLIQADCTSGYGPW